MTEPVSHPLADAMAQALNAHADHLRVNHAEHRKAERLDFLEHLEGEGVEAIHQILDDHLASLDLDAETRAMLDRIVKPTHQAELGAVAGILIGIGYIVASAIMTGPASGLAIESMRTAGRYAIPPDQLAVGSITGRVGSDWAQDAARDTGVSAGQFSALETMTQRSLPPETWMQLWRWGRIGDGDIDRVLRLNGLDAESIESVKRLRLGPPSAAFAAQARTQNQISEETFVDLLAANGIEPGWASAIYETEGQTMPPMMANEAYRRGIIDLATYQQILIESNLKNKYVPILEQLRWRVPPMRQTVAAFHNGSIDREMAEVRLAKLGFDDIDRKWMLDSAAKSTGSAGKHLSMQQHLAAYEAQLESREDAVSALLAIGWSASDIELEIDVADHRANLARVSRSANAIGTRYVTWKIDRHAATVALDALQLPSAARDEALAAWDVEREEKRPHLSMADLKAAHKKKVITDTEVRDELTASGHTARETDILMKTYFA